MQPDLQGSGTFGRIHISVHADPNFEIFLNKWDQDQIPMLLADAVVSMGMGWVLLSWFTVHLNWPG
jgi:hypothetical protein